MLTHLSLFSGIGGIDIAAEWAGFTTICFVEIDPFCQKVLQKHWPDTPITEDIRDVKGKEFESVDLITGGFPCQPFSVAGKRKGTSDNRYLWPEMFRVIREIKPSWVVAENVYGLINLQGGMVLQQAYSDLESEGYETIPPIILPACGVDAPHQRYRVFIVAYTPKQPTTRANNKNISQAEQMQPRRDGGQSREPNQWAIEPNMGRVAYGIPNRMDRDLMDRRLRALGNAVVPQQIYPILKAIAETYQQ